MGIFSRIGGGGNHKPDMTVEKFVNFYTRKGAITPEQHSALVGMARSSADQALVEELEAAIAMGTIVFEF